MFGKRADGRKVKNVDPFFRLIPHIMNKRSDSQVYFKQELPIAILDEYIDEKLKEGIKLSYMYLIYAALIKTISQRPKLNRFVMDGKIYTRNKIFISLAVKKGLSDDAEETTTKLAFDGNENIFDVKRILDEVLEKNKEVKNANETDKLAKVLSMIPNWLLKFVIGLIKFADKKGLLPKSIIDASPFHTSAFLTNVGSIGLDAIYHHLYDFGTTGVFLAMGRKKKKYIYGDEIKEEKSITTAWVVDERICDGYYYANSMKLFYKYLKNPRLLEEKIEKKEDVI